jgi:hypothetical protein
MIRLTSLLVFTLSIVVARANTSVTGETLFKWCTSEPQSIENGYCDLYIAGFVQGANISNGKDNICLPAEFTPAEAREVFIRTVRSLKEPQSKFLLSQRLDEALGATLGMTFRCRKNSN